MNDDLITIEVDGQSLKAHRGQMLIEVTDKAGIYVPRFCYHEKLSVSANCRMCLVDVEKAPKPMPACATPVLDGMKISTTSTVARDAQKATMEFLLINHPLDCPICDQGGECELQDLSMGYGSDVSRYSEAKRVVKDHDIGPLVQTELTRCIHCTRCIRVGDEIAGMRELGATGRAETMTIGTYVEKAMTSELSGNVIDVCPVGALTSKPYRYTARAWELRQTDAIAPHDCVGSNIHLHIKGNKVKRVVPKHNDDINEQWISDRDRFSYEGLYSDDRLQQPMIKKEGQWQSTDWQTALETASAGLKQVAETAGSDRLAALSAPNATVEELYLLQKLIRGLGSNNIDHRLRQQDFSDDEFMPKAPTLGCSLVALEDLDTALIIGGWPRHQQPMLNHRLHVVADHGTRIMAVNPLDYEFNYNIVEQIVVPESKIASELLGICRALVDSGVPVDGGDKILQGISPTEQQQTIAEELKAGKQGKLLLGNTAKNSIHASMIRSVAGLLSKLSGMSLVVMSEAANSVGAWLAGAVPHRLPGSVPSASKGLAVGDMLNSDMAGYLLLNTEPELDCADSELATESLNKADFVVSITAYDTAVMREYANVLLPMAGFVESSGTYVNCEGVWQSFAGSVPPVGESRPAWKILRVLGNHLSLDGFNFDSSEEICNEVRQMCDENCNYVMGQLPLPDSAEDEQSDGYQLFMDTPIYSTDALVRRATALQKTPHVCDEHLHMNSATAKNIAVKQDDLVEMGQAGHSEQKQVQIDDRLPNGMVMLHGGQRNSVSTRLPLKVTKL